MSTVLKIQYFISKIQLGLLQQHVKTSLQKVISVFSFLHKSLVSKVSFEENPAFYENHTDFQDLV